METHPASSQLLDQDLAKGLETCRSKLLMLWVVEQRQDKKER